MALIEPNNKQSNNKYWSKYGQCNFWNSVNELGCLD